VHPFHLKVHLKSHDLKAAVGRSNLGPGGWINLMNHIGKSFKVAINPKQDSSSQPILPYDWSAIEVPVPGLPIILGFKCTFCGWLLGSRDSLKVHCTKKHKQPITTAVIMEFSDTPSHDHYSRVYLQRLFPSGTPSPPLFPPQAIRCYFEIIHLPKAIIQPQPSTLVTQFSSHSTYQIPVTTLPPYISALGWVEWLEKAKLTKGFFKWLVAIPKKQEVNARNETLEKVEHGLWETSQLLKEYLNAADEMLGTMAPGIRDLIRGQ